MNKYLKRFGVMFLMAFAALTVKGGVNASAAIGEQLLSPEAGWQRFDDSDWNIYRSNEVTTAISESSYLGSNLQVNCKESSDMQYVSFSFYGTKIRLLGDMASNCAKKNSVLIDGVQEDCPVYLEDGYKCTSVYYEKTGLNEGLHTITIIIPVEFKEPAFCYWSLDCIDIDMNGYLSSAPEDFRGPITDGLKLDKQKANLMVGETDKLGLEILPHNATNRHVVWETSDDSIATVDQNGKVTALKAGKVVISVTTEDGNITNSCEYTIAEAPKVEAQKRVTLEITMSNNSKKKFEISEKELEEFLEWYDAKSNGNGSSYYIFNNKTSKNELSNKTYVPFNRIEFFDVREHKAK